MSSLNLFHVKTGYIEFFLQYSLLLEILTELESCGEGKMLLSKLVCRWNMLWKGHCKLSKYLAQDDGQDRLFTTNNVSSTLYLCSFQIISNFSAVAVGTSQRFISILTDNIVMVSHKQVIFKKQYKTIFVQDTAQEPGLCLGLPTM